VAKLTANRTNWFIDPPSAPLSCQVKIRYNSRRVPATVEACRRPTCLPL